MKLKWIIFILIIILWIFGGIGLIIHIQTPSDNTELNIEIIKYIFLLLGGLGVILPTYLNIWQQLENSKSYQRENAFKLIEKLDSLEYAEAQKEISELTCQKLELSENELIKKIEATQKYKDSMIKLMNFWEMTRLSIDSERVDETIIKDYISGIYIQFYETFKPWIESKTVYKNDANKLYKKWKK